MNEQNKQAIAAAVEAGGAGFAQYLADRGYTNPESITLGLLKAYAKTYRETGHLERVNRRTFAGNLREE